MRFMVMWRMTAMFRGPFPVRSLTRSSWKTTSRTQCRRFSTPQWARNPKAKTSASSLAETEIIAALAGFGAVSLDAGFDHRDHRQMGKARLAGISTVGDEPVDMVADEMAALFDPAMVGVGRLMKGFDALGLLIGEEVFDVLEQNRPIGFEREQIVAAARNDRLSDVGLGSHGVDGDEGALEVEALQKRRNGADFVGFVGDRLLTQHQPLPRGPCADHVQRLPAPGARMRAPRGLAVDRHNVGLVLAQTFDPLGKTGLKKLGIKRVDDVVQSVVGRQSPLVRVEPPKKVQSEFAPHPDFNEILHAAQAGAHNQEQDFPQRVDDPPVLARILQRRKMIEKALPPRRGHQGLRFVEAPSESRLSNPRSR